MSVFQPRLDLFAATGLNVSLPTGRTTYDACCYPQAVDNHFSVQLLQTIDSLVRDMGAGGYDNYYDLVTKRSLDLRTEPQDSIGIASVSGSSVAFQ